MCPSILVMFHFMVLKYKGREPTREAALKRRADEYDTFLAEQDTVQMSMPVGNNPQSAIQMGHSTPIRRSFWSRSNTTAVPPPPPPQPSEDFSFIRPLTWRS